jgi:hypothetical protein
MSNCSGCGSVPVLFNQFVNMVGINYAPKKPGPFDGNLRVRNINTINNNTIISHVEQPKPAMNKNGTHIKFIRSPRIN